MQPIFIILIDSSGFDPLRDQYAGVLPLRPHRRRPSFDFLVDFGHFSIIFDKAATTAGSDDVSSTF